MRILFKSCVIASYLVFVGLAACSGKAADPEEAADKAVKELENKIALSCDIEGEIWSGFQKVKDGPIWMYTPMRPYGGASKDSNGDYVESGNGYSISVNNGGPYLTFTGSDSVRYPCTHKVHAVLQADLEAEFEGFGNTPAPISSSNEEHNLPISGSSSVALPALVYTYGGKFRSGPGTSYDQPFDLNMAFPVTIVADAGEQDGYHWFKLQTQKGLGFQPGVFLCVPAAPIPDGISGLCGGDTIKKANKNLKEFISKP